MGSGRHTLADFRRVFRPRDILAIPVLIAATFAAALSVTGLAGVSPAPLVLVALVAWSVAGVRVARRLVFRRRITFITKHGVGVIANGLPIEAKPLEAYLDWFIQLWEHETDWPVAAALDGALLVWKPPPREPHSRPSWVERAWPRDRTFVIGYRDELRRTFLGHELAHLVMRQWRGQNSETALRDFAAERGLPH